MIPLLSSYIGALQGFLHNEMNAAIEEPNAGAQALLKAGATQERTLEAVGCSALIMYEASPSAYPSGMLVVDKPG